MSILGEIVAHKRVQVENDKAALPLDVLRARPEYGAPRRGFVAALRAQRVHCGLGLIAEIKKASPSAGVIRADFDVAAIAEAYQQAGAAALSVLTDEQYFQGHAGFLTLARAVTTLPVLRKDFVIDPWQIDEARLIGADAVLLIASCLDDADLGALAAHARDVGLDVLFEVHTSAELARVMALPLDAGRHAIGVNNRDLATFVTDVSLSARLAPEVRSTGVLMVSESGIASRQHVESLTASGVDAFLVGESLMRHDDVAAACRTLFPELGGAGA